MHALITLSVYLLGLTLTAAGLALISRSPARPRPFFIVGSIGTSIAFLGAAYSGFLAGKALRLVPPDWLITVITVSFFIIAPPALVAVVAAFAMRRKNQLYRRAFFLAIALLVLAAPVPFLPRTKLPEGGSTTRPARTERASLTFQSPCGA